MFQYLCNQHPNPCTKNNFKKSTTISVPPTHRKVWSENHIPQNAMRRNPSSGAHRGGLRLERDWERTSMNKIRNTENCFFYSSEERKKGLGRKLVNNTLTTVCITQAQFCSTLNNRKYTLTHNINRPTGYSNLKI